MTNEQRLHYFMHAAGLSQDEDGVAIGYTYPHFVPAGVDEVMKQHTKEIDGLLQQMPQNDVQALELIMLRGFTFHEYKLLFDLGIKERDFAFYPIFRSLWLQSDAERRKVIYHLDRESFDDYFTLLAKSLAQFNPHLLTFFFTAQAYRQTSSSCTPPSHAHHRTQR